MTLIINAKEEDVDTYSDWLVEIGREKERERGIDMV